ncbi:MAG: glutamate--tRNA ligase family protein, partial [Candidatus Hodarchaeota archaeon]
MPLPNSDKKNQKEPSNESKVDLDFIRKIVSEDVKEGKYERQIMTRFPPEPNGWLHIGHAKAIHLNFSIADEYNGLCNLRFDDTDPAKESMEYVEAIKEDVKWLGFDWEDRLYFASDYFEELYNFAIELIKAGKAYICDLSVEEIKEQRGTITHPGKESPYRNRSIEENLDLFERMRNGEFKDGSRVLRAKIDMSSPNMLMRDPIMYRIKRIPHYRTG